MKKMLVFGATTLLLAVGSSVSAQTCTSPTTLVSNTTGTPGNSCNGDATLGNICSNLQNTGKVDVYTWSYGGANTPSGSLTVTPTGTAWNPAIAVASSTDCASATGAGCANQADANPSGTGAGSAETLPLAGLTTQGKYFFFVTSFAAGTTCGTYTLDVGTLPVKLQSFSIN